jgi:hypothetical protein
MSIQVSCQCGKRLTAKDEFAGKRVKCPACGGPLLIPQPQTPQAAVADDGISDLLDDAGMRAGVTRCPGCGAEMTEQAVLCVMCGYDMRRGHRIKTRVGEATEFDDEELGDLPVHGVPQLDEAERALARDQIEQKNLSKGAPWWMILLAFLGVVGFAIGMVAMPQDQVVQNSAYVLMVAGGLMGFWFGLQLLIAAFKESALQGILLLLIAPYALVYVITRWDRVGGIFIFMMIGTVLQWVGYGMLFLVPVFEKMRQEEEEDFTLLRRQNQPAIVKVFTQLEQI